MNLTSNEIILKTIIIKYFNIFKYYYNVHVKIIYVNLITIMNYNCSNQNSLILYIMRIL